MLDIQAGRRLAWSPAYLGRDVLIVMDVKPTTGHCEGAAPMIWSAGTGDDVAVEASDRRQSEADLDPGIGQHSRHQIPSRARSGSRSEASPPQVCTILWSRLRPCLVRASDEAVAR